MFIHAAAPRPSCPNHEKYSQLSRFTKDYVDYSRRGFATMKSRQSLTLTWSLGFVWVACSFSSRRSLTSTSETSFFGPPPPPPPCCCWMAWIRSERLSKVWGAGGRVSFKDDTRTIRCWGQETRGRRRSMRTESQQSFSLFSFSCSTNTSRLSSSCSSACRVWEGCVCKVGYLWKAKSWFTRLWGKDLWPLSMCVCVFRNCVWP